MIDPTAQALDQWDQQTQSFLSSQNWDPSDSTWLLAVSGGADSVALLHWALRNAPGFRANLAVAHLDHGLRPESPADAAFTADLCRRLNVPFHLRTLDPALRPARVSVEMWARGERYGFFDSVAAALAAKTESAPAPVWTLTAHHRDDLVETVFQRLGRGTGARGLRGIPFRRGAIVRPFLNRPRADILDYLGLLGETWREDASNANVAIDRNWYRHRLLPALRGAEPDLDRRILDLALTVQSLGHGIDALEAQDALLQTDADGRPHLIRDGLDAMAAAGDLEGLDFWIRSLVRASRAALPAITPSRPGGKQSRPLQVTKEILREFCRQWKNGPNSLQVPVNGTLSLKCRNQGIYCVETASLFPIGHRLAKKNCPPEDQRVILIEGSAHTFWRWGERMYSLVARRYPRPLRLEYPSPAEERAIFDADLFSCTLLIRTRKDGDRFSPLGIQSRSRKLKTFFNEEKVPIGMRDSLPIVLVREERQGVESGGETAAWVPGHGISDFFKVSGSTSHILELVLTCENP